MSDRVRVEIQDGVADVRMTRADKMNALDGEMFSALTEAGVALAEDKSLRAFVLSGEGRSFCAGLDVSNFANAGSLDPFARSDASPANRVQRVAWVWNEVPVPVIAAIHARASWVYIGQRATPPYASQGTALPCSFIREDHRDPEKPPSRPRNPNVSVSYSTAIYLVTSRARDLPTRRCCRTRVVVLPLQSPCRLLLLRIHRTHHREVVQIFTLLR